MEQKPPSDEQRRDQAIAAMRQASGKPVPGNVLGQPVEAGQKANIYHMARHAADFLDQVGDDADNTARLFSTECRRLAEEYRNLTDQFLTRLIGPRK